MRLTIKYEVNNYIRLSTDNWELFKVELLGDGNKYPEGTKLVAFQSVYYWLFVTYLIFDPGKKIKD